MSESNEKITFEAKKRANTGCLRGILYFMVIVGVSLFLSVFAWTCINDVLALSKPNHEASISIPENYTIPELARMLNDAGVIEQPWLFILYCNFSNAEDTIVPNPEDYPAYSVNANLDYHAIILRLIPVRERETVTVTVPEGKNLRETLKIISDAGVSDYESLLAAVDESDFSYDFLKDNPLEEGRLEGYLFPNTYTFFSDASPRSVLIKFLASFNTNLTPMMRKSAEGTGYTLHEILTVASMIQMEAANVAEMKAIAGVIYNRLKNPSSFPYLQIDATVQYLLPEHKEILTAEDLAIDSPYNTRLYPGLPPGPICSPGIEAIRAALYPENNKYFFYALGKDGSHHFFETSAGFEKFKNSSDFVYN